MASGALLLFAFAAIILWCLPILVTYDLGKRRGQELSWLWGLLLGWVGVLGVLLIGDQTKADPHRFGSSFSAQPPAMTKTCPRCAEDVKAAAKVCRFCGYEFEPFAPPDVR